MRQHRGKNLYAWGTFFSKWDKIWIRMIVSSLYLFVLFNIHILYWLTNECEHHIILKQGRGRVIFFLFLYSNMVRIILIFLVVSSLSAYYIGKVPPRPIARSYLPHKTTCDYSIQRPHRNSNLNAYRRYQKYDSR